MRDECKTCPSYLSKTSQAPDGLCELIMDATGSGCGRVHEATIRKSGCPAGKFAAETKRNLPTPVRQGLPWTIRHAATKDPRIAAKYGVEI